MRRGISEKSVRVLNPLPVIDDAEVLERAGLAETAEAANLSPLNIDWQYSGGLEREFIRLGPGESQVMRTSDAAAMMSEKLEMGLVVVALDADDETIKKISVEGLKRAVAFYADRGNKRLQNIRKRFGLTKEEMEENKHEHWSFYYNQALADLLRKHLNEVAPNAAMKKRLAKSAQE